MNYELTLTKKRENRDDGTDHESYFKTRKCLPENFRVLSTYKQQKESVGSIYVYTGKSCLCMPSECGKVRVKLQ